MFDSTLNPLWQRYILAVQEEVKPALGCTEPISLALAAVAAAAPVAISAAVIYGLVKIF
ncbi:hypothetical protein LLB57_005469, partial [Escherichia coli]|nr:hypothetical protein [Escherichia coli]HDD9386116.1 hypothetical protein [Escherichia coli]